jgi:hypothetical protein
MRTGFSVTLHVRYLTCVLIMLKAFCKNRHAIVIPTLILYVLRVHKSDILVYEFYQSH